MSEATAEVEATAIHAPGTDLARYAQAAPAEYRARFVMEPAEAAELDEQLRTCMRAVLKPEVDFGVIPGMGNKPSLFKPGAQKLIQWFGFGFTNDEVKTERDDPEHPSGIADKARRIGVTYRCTVYKELADGRRVTVATCEAYAGYDEDKFYVPLEKAQAKAEENERMWARKDNRAPRPEKWEKATEYRAPWNSVVKMCEKRSLVGAAIDATAAAGLFTQDLEDMRGSAPEADGAFTDAADTAIRALPEQVRDGLDRWYRAQRWPSPDRWTAEQWVTALQEAGRLAATSDGPEGPQPPRTPVPEPEQAAQPAPAGWNADDMIASATTAPTLTACRALWRQVAAAAKSGLCTGAEAKRVQDLLSARMEDLKSATAGLSPEDPWAVKVDGIATASDAEQAMAELLTEFKAGRVNETRANTIKAAISAKAAQVADVIEGKVAA